MDGETVAAVAARLRVSVSDLHDWAAWGLVELVGGKLSPVAVERARLIAGAVRRGIDAHRIADACEQQGDLLDGFLALLGEPKPLGADLPDAAQAAGVDVAFARRLWTARGMDPDDELFPDDVEAMTGIRTALDAGLPADALVQITRVLGDALGRVADAEVRLFHFYVHGALRRKHGDPQAARAETNGAAAALHTLMEPAILYAHRKAFERALRDDLLLHLTEESASPSDVAELHAAILFVDLSAYTLMTEAMGDTAVMEVLDRFSDAVRAIALSHDGRIVKQIGDEFMLVFRNAASMVSFATECADALADESHFPEVRMGGHVGPVLFREADYLGATVNIAARIAGLASAGELLATEDVRRATVEVVPWDDAGVHQLRGMVDTTPLFRARLTAADALRDPVCRMRLSADAGDLRAEWSGSTFHFCSEGCRARFVDAPRQFVTTSTGSSGGPSDDARERDRDSVDDAATLG